MRSKPTGLTPKENLWYEIARKLERQVILSKNIYIPNQPPPSNVIAPVISGDPSLGSTLSTTNGTWSNSPTSYTYQWKRNGVNIGGATSSTYIITSSDYTTNITCEVTASNSGGSSSQDSSNQILIFDVIISGYFNRLNTLVYAKPSLTVLYSYDTFFKNIGSSIYNNMDVFHGFALLDNTLSNAMTVNIVRTTLSQGAFVNSPTITTDGFQGNGSTSFFDTNFNASTMGITYTLNNSSRGCHIRTAPTIGNALDGAGSARNNFMASNTANHRINAGSNTLNLAVDLSGTGYRAINRTTNMDVQLYSGLTKFDRTQMASGIENADQMVGTNNVTFSNTKFTMYYMGGSFTETQHNTIRNEWLANLTRLGL